MEWKQKEIGEVGDSSIAWGAMLREYVLTTPYILFCCLDFFFLFHEKECYYFTCCPWKSLMDMVWSILPTVKIIFEKELKCEWTLFHLACGSYSYTLTSQTNTVDWGGIFFHHHILMGEWILTRLKAKTKVTTMFISLVRPRVIFPFDCGTYIL